MAIQMRRGNAVDFNPSKMRPGEWAVSQDNQKIYMCFSQGVVVEIGSATALMPYVYLSEAWARGTKDGEPVEITDPTYHNNSKYYSEQAADSATNAALSETNAGISETNAGLSETHAATSESNANTSEENAEAWSVGTIDGQPVPSTHPAYENNAKHWADIASAIVGIGLATTTEPGIVMPDGTSITVDIDGTIHGTSYEYDSTNELLTFYNVSSH